MRISIIAAATDNHVIGRDNDLPWQLPADLKHFKRLTLGHHLVMGRKTYDSLGGPLPGRTIVVISRSLQPDSEGILWATSLTEALERAADDDEVFIAGGGEIYLQAIGVADRIYLTRIHAAIDGDTVFPALDENLWHVLEEEHHDADEKHEHPFTFLTLDRIR